MASSIANKSNIYYENKVYLDKTSIAIDQTLKIEKAFKFVESHDWKEISKSFSDDIKRLT
jgi:hypothetical protein